MRESAFLGEHSGNVSRELKQEQGIQHPQAGLQARGREVVINSQAHFDHAGDLRS